MQIIYLLFKKTIYCTILFTTKQVLLSLINDEVSDNNLAMNIVF